MMLKDYRTAQEKLEMSRAYLGQIAPNEEFDKAAWLLLAGKYALLTENYIAATQFFEEALRELPKQWTLRRTITALGLTKAYTRMRERDRSISVAEELVPTMKLLDAQLINKWFLEYLRQDLLSVFPTDNRVQLFVNDMYRRIS